MRSKVDDSVTASDHSCALCVEETYNGCYADDVGLHLYSAALHSNLHAYT